MSLKLDCFYIINKGLKHGSSHNKKMYQNKIITK